MNHQIVDSVFVSGVSFSRLKYRPPTSLEVINDVARGVLQSRWTQTYLPRYSYLVARVQRIAARLMFDA